MTARGTGTLHWRAEQSTSALSNIAWLPRLTFLSAFWGSNVRVSHERLTACHIWVNLEPRNLQTSSLLIALYRIMGDTSFWQKSQHVHDVVVWDYGWSGGWSWSLIVSKMMVYKLCDVEMEVIPWWLIGCRWNYLHVAYFSSTLRSCCLCIHTLHTHWHGNVSLHFNLESCLIRPRQSCCFTLFCLIAIAAQKLQGEDFAFRLPRLTDWEWLSSYEN